LLTLTLQSSLSFGEKQAANRWNKERHGSVANSPRLILAVAVASRYDWLRR
jgi:hypothetical protein